MSGPDAGYPLSVTDKSETDLTVAVTGPTGTFGFGLVPLLESDARVSITVTCDELGARQFLGPYAKEFLTFADPDRHAVTAFGLSTLPAIVHVRQDLSIAGAAEGWDPDGWREVTEGLSLALHWARPSIPALRDPAPYPGTPAAG